jgi:spore germination cell wall hydrolase CwlJ-like protein
LAEHATTIASQPRVLVAAGAAILALAGAAWWWTASPQGQSTLGPSGSALELPEASANRPPPAEAFRPLDLEPVTPTEAVDINAAIPIVDMPNPAARAFSMPLDGPDYARALDCLTAAVYYEAAIESDDGQRAVAQVVLNRARSPAYPATVCEVVFQGWERPTGCQFTFTCDGSIARVPSAAGWQRARKVAERALAGQVFAPVGLATHYHTNWVVPVWAKGLDKNAVVGTHIFYRWKGGWGQPYSFRRKYPGGEPLQTLLSERYASHRLEPLAAEAVVTPDLLSDETVSEPVRPEPRLEADRKESRLLADQKAGGPPPRLPEPKASRGEGLLAQAPSQARSAQPCGLAAASPLAPVSARVSARVGETETARC